MVPARSDGIARKVHGISSNKVFLRGKPVKEGERICGRCEPNVTREELSDLLLQCEYKTELVATLMDTIAKATSKDPDWLVEYVDDSLAVRRAGGGRNGLGGHGHVHCGLADVSIREDIVNMVSFCYVQLFVCLVAGF